MVPAMMLHTILSGTFVWVVSVTVLVLVVTRMFVNNRRTTPMAEFSFGLVFT